MNFSHHRIDVNKYLVEDKMPQLIINRGDHNWLVAMSPVLDDKPVDWAICKTENAVLIPLVPYRLNSVPEQALAHMFSLGIRISASLAKPVSHLHVAYGTPVGDGSDDPQGRLLFWIGFGVILA